MVDGRRPTPFFPPVYRNDRFARDNLHNLRHHLLCSCSPYQSCTRQVSFRPNLWATWRDQIQTVVGGGYRRLLSRALPRGHRPSHPLEYVTRFLFRVLLC